MFSEFDLENLENASVELDNILEESRESLKQLLEIKNKTYRNFVLPFQEIGERINEFVTPIFHIDSVKNSELTSKVYEECLPIISKYESEVSQNENIYKSLKFIQSNEISTLNDIQKKVLENEIRNFELSGCNLEKEKKQRLEELDLELSELSHKFSQNILKATNAYSLVVEDFEEIKDIPESDLALARFEEDGRIKYKFTLQMPSYIPFMTYCKSREKREELYKALVTRAPENGKIIEEIITLKEEKVKILGFSNFAQYSIATKMAKTEQEVIEFLEELGSKAKPKAIKEFEELKELALKDGINDFRASDAAFYSEKLIKAQYDLDEEYYRPYFEQNSVLKGFFEFLNKMFDVKFTQVDAKTWDEKVQVYNLSENEKIIARIYIDLEARADKRGGAWMNNWHSYYKTSNDEIKLPTAYIVGDFPQSTNEIPSLLRHSDVVTLFHEMGHALHHLLSKVEEPFVSGIAGVAWDVVEFPSQFLEYFSYDKDVLKLFAKHYKTKEVLDDEAINRLIKARNFQSSMSTVRQIEFALFDFRLHQRLYKKESQIQELLDEVREKFAVSIPPSYNKSQNTFSHIFSGGYSAGYYSYKWAEVLSADTFYMFIQSGNIFNKELGLKYKESILSKGGSYDMDKLFYDFAKREPKIDSLLKIDGII